MKVRKRISAMLLVFVLVFSTVGYTPVAAVEHVHDDACGYRAEVPCDHTTHDDTCGYKEATEGAACSHEHDENCYGQVGNCQHIHGDECGEVVQNASPSNTTEPTDCTHECTADTGCIAKELDCPHIHDGECGYVPAADEQPCKHEQGVHDETCSYAAEVPCNAQAGSSKMKKILQKTNVLPSAETLLKNAECVVPSETANTEEAVTNWIKTTWLSGILVLDDALGGEYNVGIEDLEIATIPEAFTAATNGTAENPEGTAGKFTFSVVVPGTGNDQAPRLTVEKTCKITPKIHSIAETATVAGTVTTANGTPVAGWTVLATDKNNNPIAEAETGKNGEYRFEALQANENYTLSVEGVTGDSSTPVTTGGQGSQLSKNITLATRNIPGATSANLQTSDGIPVVSEFVPTGNITVDNTLSAESYSPTEQDYIAVIDQVSPGAKKVEGEMVEIPEKDIEVIENFQFQGVDYKIGELVLINHVFYIVKSARVLGGSAGEADALYLLNMSDGLDYYCRENQTLPGMYINDSKYDITYEKGKIIYINGVKYYNNYKAANTVFPTVYTLVRWDGNGVPVEAGMYDIGNTGAWKGKPAARFNKGYSPSELPKDIVDEITPVTDTFITRDDKLLEMLVRFSSDLTVTNNESQETDIPGTTSITGIDNIGSNVIAVHKGENGYEVGTAIKNGYSWYGSSRSPFMIFSVNEINTEIPARLIPTDSGDGSGDSSSSSDDSTYNPDVLRGTWIRTDAGIWKFRMTSGAYAKSRWGLVDGLWYYFDSEGKMLTGWQFLNNRWYYLCTEETSKLATGRKEGAMLTGWYYDPMYQGWFYLDASGAMATGWKEISEKWYFFYENGVMAVNTQVDGYELGPDGAWKK